MYATVFDLTDRFGEREIEELVMSGTSAADMSRSEKALADGAAEIDAYLAGRYELPLAGVPKVLTRLNCDIARYRLWDDQASEEVRARYEDAVRFLEAVAKGHIALGPREQEQGCTDLVMTAPANTLQRPNSWRGV